MYLVTCEAELLIANPLHELYKEKVNMLLYC